MVGELTVGALAYDTVEKRCGVVMDVHGSLIALRPRHGGIEWDARRENVRTATVDDRLRSALTELNANSSRPAP
ncbi:hypothetical protein ACH4E8_17785 [Streptomyces sp. NPDC017979]|uniref:hypothetical protein n=1 Tax=Streptomyces sp. NPDC017979 TaxID=3365024 RepID=UPI0037A1FB5D